MISVISSCGQLKSHGTRQWENSRKQGQGEVPSRSDVSVDAPEQEIRKRSRLRESWRWGILDSCEEWLMPRASPRLNRKGIAGAPWENWSAFGSWSWWERGRGPAQARGASESGPQCQRHECRHSHGDAATEHKNLSEQPQTRKSQGPRRTSPLRSPSRSQCWEPQEAYWANTVPYVPRVRFGVNTLFKSHWNATCRPKIGRTCYLMTWKCI